jgi:hypothetical protein
MDHHTCVCGIQIIQQSLPSIYLSTGAYPVEFTSPACPDNLPQCVECNSGTTAGEPKCLPVARDMPL